MDPHIRRQAQLDQVSEESSEAMTTIIVGIYKKFIDKGLPPDHALDLARTYMVQLSMRMWSLQDRNKENPNV